MQSRMPGSSKSSTPYRKKILVWFACFALVILMSVDTARAALITSYYGDNDGFGAGYVGSLPMNPWGVNNQSVGEAAYTDTGLIGNSFSQPAFGPSGSFNPFTLSGEPIVSAYVTISLGAFDSQPPLDGPNRIFLDGLEVAGFFSLIPDRTGYTYLGVDTVTAQLSSSFFPLLSDGLVSLAGTHISEASGSGSFMVDYVRLDINTESIPVPANPVPEPGTLLLLGSGVAGLGFMMRKFRFKA